jgi:hypothetical protein
MKSVFIFVLVGILVTFFNKNMIIVLGLAVIVTNVIKLGNIIPAPNKEGFTDDKEDDEDDIEEEGETGFTSSGLLQKFGVITSSIRSIFKSSEK